MIVCVRRHMCMTIRDGWVRIRASVPTITEPQNEKVYVCVRVCVCGLARRKRAVDDREIRRCCLVKTEHTKQRNFNKQHTFTHTQCIRSTVEGEELTVFPAPL
jgi:hypothetical protein